MLWTSDSSRIAGTRPSHGGSGRAESSARTWFLARDCDSCLRWPLSDAGCGAAKTHFVVAREETAKARPAMAMAAKEAKVERVAALLKKRQSHTASYCRTIRCEAWFQLSDIWSPLVLAKFKNMSLLLRRLDLHVAARKHSSSGNHPTTRRSRKFKTRCNQIPSYNWCCCPLLSLPVSCLPRCVANFGRIPPHSMHI